MTRIPNFTDGALPPGDFEVTVEDILASHLVTGRGRDPEQWDRKRRLMLAENLATVVDLFRRTGMVSEIVVNGSFVEEHDSPTDIDCYFLLHDDTSWFDGSLDRALQQLDPDGGWDWDARVDCGAETQRRPFWGKYHVDIFPEVGDPCGIQGRDGAELTFSQAFRQRTVSGKAKGVLRIRVSERSRTRRDIPFTLHR